MLAVGAAQYKLHIEGIPIAFEVDANPAFCNERKMQLKRSLRNFQECIWKLRGLEEAEYACLRTILLFSPGKVFSVLLFSHPFLNFRCNSNKLRRLFFFLIF